MSEDSNAPADLSSLGQDLSEMFRPSWTKQGGGGVETTRLAGMFSGEERPERRERTDRFPRREGRPGRERTPRTEGSDRAPRRDPRDRQGGDARRQGGGRGRPERGGGRPEHPPKAAAPAPVLEGWKLDLIPDPAAIEGIAKQVRSRAKAYPLFELSRLILKLSDRYGVRLAPLSAETPGLFRVRADGSLWTTRKEATDHLLNRHLEKFYRRSTVATEPPKGAFTVIAQCGMSGVLLGPPNHHEYTSKVIALHAARFKTMPFEVFKSRIRMMRDEAILEQWKTEQSTTTVYTPVTPGEEAPETAEVPPPPAPSARAEEPPAEESPVQESPEVTEPAPENTAPQEVSAETVTEEHPSSEETAEVAPAEGVTSEETAPASTAATADSQGLSFAEAAAHFLANHADQEIEAVSGELTLSGRAALHESTKPLRELLLAHLREMDRFPLPLAQVVGKELTALGLQLFKSHKKIIHVSMARPRYLDRQTTPIGENFKAILEYLEAHPNQRRDKQWAALLSLRTETAETAPVSVAPESEASGGAVPSPDEETMKRREQALGADLLWLLHQGHVLDFAMGNLQAATPPKPQPAKKEPTKPATDATLTGDTGEVQPGGSATSASEPSDVIVEAAGDHAALEIPAGTALQTPPPEDPGRVLPS